ncbi:hypothetical protein Pla110_18200 [Polystyrenella longa]|uniref:Uncharacterized protein n=1 Tax=Polystyrenella longa TaxID=2528007 RepID=A0A518CLI3_9PLAN|nr:hypothetical protein [Polystyrenella longa]QDU80098.1 hypothetical protein Pla110_18200 [Polystyrenella longa]
MFKELNTLKNWKELTVSDFSIAPSEFTEDNSSKVNFNNHELSVYFSRRELVNERVVELCKKALTGWLSSETQIISKTEEIIDDFLPGRKVQPSELFLWAMNVFSPDGNPKPPVELMKHPNGISFMYKVGGDYSDPSYEYDEFDKDTTIELIYEVNNYEIDWGNPDYDITNDFA